MREGQITDKCICPRFFQYWRGFRRVFVTGQIPRAKVQRFRFPYICTLITIIYINNIYICPICPIVKETNKGAGFERTDNALFMCPNVSVCPEIIK